MISLSFLSPFVISQVSLGPGERTYCPREQGVSQKCRLHPGAETHRILESVLLLSLHWSLAAAVAWGARAQPPLQSSHPGAAFHSPHPSLSASPLLLPSTGAFLLDRTVSNQSRCRRTTACPSFFFLNLFILFIFGCVGSVAARGLSLVAASGGFSSLRCAGFSLRWLLLLRSTGSRRVGFSSCGTRAQ